jgi:argininosuccinate synthase
LKKQQIKKVVLAYSGGLDTSITIAWLKENYGCKVITYTGDLGQGQELDGLEAKARKSGASKVFIEDLRKPFIEQYIYPTMQMGAVYEDRYLLGTSFARPILAKRMAEIAIKEGADAVSHGATGKGNDQVRFEVSMKAFAPHLKIIAPWREWKIRSRNEAIEYADKLGVPITSTKERDYSEDANIWHISHESGMLEDPCLEPPEDVYCKTTSPQDAPDKPEYLRIRFEKGFPTSVNGKKMGSVKLLETLNEIGGRHGIGRLDIVENRLVGMKSRGIYETPGGALMYAAHRELEDLVLDRQTAHYKSQMALKYGELVYDGLWYTPLREAMDAFVAATQKNVTGEVKLKLYKGNIIMAGRKSKYSLYREDLATFQEDDIYDQTHAEGFITLFGLPITVQAMLKGKGKKRKK